ncbi:MAG: ferric reductase-like transmembrane domain-containing protein [Candidatus Moranbacteria bacterium]|nr:ferric reductase-like transmembrane domain-containing protein [Candidatus Moranbacteria bacterium]
MLTILLHKLFFAHDIASGILARHLFFVKRFLLFIAHASLLGFLFPEWRKEFGSLAATVLIIILFLSPLAKISGMRLLAQCLALRRELGILMGYLALVHGLGFLLDPRFFHRFIEPFLWSEVFFINPGILFGGVALFVTFPLLCTSNDLALRFLGGKKWKLLHRLVYVLFATALFHRFFMRSGQALDVVSLLQAFLLGGGYVLVKILAWKNFSPSLEKGIFFVANQYKKYTENKIMVRGEENK